MSYKPVTLPQVENVRQMANEKEIGRKNFQRALWTTAVLLDFPDSLKYKPATEPPLPEIRTHSLRIRVKLDADWQKALSAAGPNTPKDHSIRKVSDQYPATGVGEVEEEYILLNYPKGDGDWDKAQAWRKANGHTNTVPREAFAVGEKFPLLHRELKCNPMHVVGTIECSFEGYRGACCVWWRGAERRANLGWLVGFGLARGWFLFRNPLHFHYPLYFRSRGFCFVSCPFHPPSILPISSIDGGIGRLMRSVAPVAWECEEIAETHFKPMLE